MDQFYEQLVKKKTKITDTLLKVLIGILAMGVLLFALMFSYPILGQMFSTFGYLVGIGAVFGGFKLIQRFFVEYEYSYINGELDFDMIIAQRSRKRLATVNCRKAEGFGKYNAEEHQNKSYFNTVFACRDKLGSDNYYFVYNKQGLGNVLVVFTPDKRMLEFLKTSVPRAYTNGLVM